VSQVEVHGKQFVAKRIEQEEALILDKELEFQDVERVKREAEEKMKSLSEEICTRKSNVGIWKKLLD